MNFIEATFLVIIVMLTHIILNLPSSIIESTGSSAIINVIFVSVVTIIFFLIINKLFNPFPGKDIIDVSDYVGGKFLKVLTCILYSAYLIFASSILILNFSELLRIIYFQNAKTYLITLIFIVTAIIANKLGLKNIIKANTLLTPVVLITVVFIFGASIDTIDYQRIFPIMGYGVNETFLAGLANIFSFSGMLLLYLIRPSLKDNKKYKKIGITAIAISALYLLFSVASLLFLFPFLTEGVDSLSVYMSTRTLELGSFFQRTDAIFILIWIFTFLSYLSVIIAYITKINKKVFSFNNTSPLIYIAGLLIFIISLIPNNGEQIRFLESSVYKYAALAIVFIYSFFILLFGFLKKIKFNLKVHKKPLIVTNKS